MLALALLSQDNPDEECSGEETCGAEVNPETEQDIARMINSVFVTVIRGQDECLADFIVRSRLVLRIDRWVRFRLIECRVLISLSTNPVKRRLEDPKNT